LRKLTLFTLQYSWNIAGVGIYTNQSTQLGQTTIYNIGICCFSAKHIALRRKNKNWLVRNQDNASEWGDMSIR